MLILSKQGKKFEMKKKILICGATGFIGRNMLEYFSRDSEYDIRALSFNRGPYSVPNNLSKIEWVKGDLRSNDFVEKIMKDIDIVIQCAATTSGSKDIVNTPYIHVTDNAIMNSLLLRSAFDNKISHFIFFSCSVMYKSSEKPLKETDFNANSPLHQNYFGVGNTKIYIEKMLEFYSSISDMKTTAIRHSNIYGPFDKYDFERSHVFGATVSKVMLAEKEISVWGQGDEGRDLLHVDDLIDFVKLVIMNQKEKNCLYNCGLGKRTKIKSLVQKIVYSSEKSLEIKFDLSKPSIDTSLYLDCKKATDELGWTPKVALEHGIERTLNWWKENIDPQTLKSRD